MLRRAREAMRLPLAAMVTDASYVTACNLAICAAEKVTLYGPWQENDYTEQPKDRGPRMIRKVDRRARVENSWHPKPDPPTCMP